MMSEKNLEINFLDHLLHFSSLSFSIIMEIAPNFMFFNLLIINSSKL